VNGLAMCVVGMASARRHFTSTNRSTVEWKHPTQRICERLKQRMPRKLGAQVRVTKVTEVTLFCLIDCNIKKTLITYTELIEKSVTRVTSVTFDDN